MPTTPGLHPVQLQELWVEQVDAARRQRIQDDPTEATLGIPRALLVKGATAREFRCRLQVNTQVPISDEEIWTAKVTIVGRFGSSIDLTPAQARSFARDSGLYVMWPFARAHLAQFAMLAGLEPPHLPLIVRPGGVRVAARPGPKTP
jgi:hypothetical protein